MSPLVYNLIHAVLWQCAWFAAVLGAGCGLIWLGPVTLVPVLALYLWHHRHERFNGCASVLAITILGLLADAVLTMVAGMRMASNTGWSEWPQFWMLGLWVQLATALTASLAWLHGRLVLAAVMGAIAGPIAYLGGARCGALTLPDGWWPIVTIACVWALALPLAVIMSTSRMTPKAVVPC